MAVSDSLRGYRTQFLYTLYRALSTQNHSLIFYPEGLEDLDIYDGNSICECIQVKNYENTLRFSDLFSKGGETNFFSRGLSVLKNCPNAKIRLYSFNTISDDLKENSKLRKKLREYNKLHLSPAQINSFLEAYIYEEVSEDNLYAEVFRLMKEIFPTSNPTEEIRFLLQWIYEMAEKSDSFTYEDIHKEREAYVAFLNVQKAALSQLGLHVKILSDVNVDDIDNAKQLHNEYFMGVSARYSHIVAGLDVVRKEKMDAMNKKFHESNVLILHGASGQGKSTLAYRFLHDYRSVVYEIRNCNSNNISEVLATIETLTDKSPSKIVLYIDVQPSNSEWVQIVSAVADLKGVQCLVTIRQEDWNQHKNGLLQNISVAELEVSMNESEALDIYEEIMSKNSSGDLPPFQEVWRREGIQGTLLEYVYYLTHGQSLKARLVQQLSEFKNQERDILALVSLGNYLCGHIKKNDISNLDHIDTFEAEDVLHRWNGEYFVIDAEGRLSDLHPIRTKIIVDFFYKDNIQAKIKNALSLYPYVDINQAHLFLIRLMHEGMDYKKLTDWENAQNQLIPGLYYGIAKALYWKGIELYKKRNQSLMDELRKDYAPIWNWLVPMNFTDINIQESVVKLFNLGHIKFPPFSDIVARFESQQGIFDLIHEWLANKRLNLKIECLSDLLQTSKLLYLLHGADIQKFDLSSSITTFDSDDLTLDDMATILLGLKTFENLNVDYSAIETHFIYCLRLKYHIIQFKRDEKGIYILSFLSYFNDDIDSKLPGTLSEQQNMKILNLCRRAFPHEKSYHAKVMEDVLLHSFPDMPIEKNIFKENFPIKEMYEPRNILTNLYKRSYLLPDRRVYAEQSYILRNEVATYIFQLVSSIESWSKKNQSDLLFSHFYEIWNSLKHVNFEVPRTEISEFGFSYDSPYNIVNENQLKSNKEKKQRVDEMTKLNKLLNSYTTDLTNFIGIAIEGMQGNEQKERISRANLYDAYANIEKMQRKYKELLSPYFTDSKLKELETKENTNIKALWVIWEAYQNKESNPLNSSTLSKVFDRKNKTLISSIVEDLNVEIREFFSKGQVYREGDVIKIDFSYSDIDNRLIGLQKCLTILRDKFSTFAYFSTEDLILSATLSKVRINPLYQYENRLINMDGCYQEISMKVLFGCQSDTEINVYSCPCENIEELQWTPRLLQYGKCNAFLLSIGMFLTTVIMAFEKIEPDDNLASEVVLEYTNSCIDNIWAHAKPADYDFSTLIHTKDKALNELLWKTSVALKQFMEGDRENIDWKTLKNLVQLIIETHDHDFEIKVALLHQVC